MCANGWSPVLYLWGMLRSHQSKGVQCSTAASASGAAVVVIVAAAAAAAAVAVVHRDPKRL